MVELILVRYEDCLARSQCVVRYEKKELFEFKLRDEIAVLFLIVVMCFFCKKKSPKATVSTQEFATNI